jgi:hypothetical protein
MIAKNIAMRARWVSLGKVIVVVTTLAGAVPRRAAADPLRLRGDALVQTRSPVGLIILHGEDKLTPSIDAETVTWAGATDTPGMTGDVLTLSARLRDVRTGSEARAGRMIVTMGAVRPLHLDGARGLVRAFGGTTAEAFAGFPVVRRFDYAAFDWAAGGRLGQTIDDKAAVGVAYLQRRIANSRADEEAGLDVTYTPARWFSAAGRAAVDLVSRGPTDALASLSVQNTDVRAELFTTHRSPGRMLPSTSLFSVLGDFAATSVGSTVRWRAFPRLELLATGSGQVQRSDIGGQGFGRATLSLDDDWSATTGVEVRRVDFGGARWTGARAILGLPLSSKLRAATEIELVVPDRPRGRGAVWPWALGALAYRPAQGWDVAAGVEASSGPEYRAELHGIARVTYAFERSTR